MSTVNVACDVAIVGGGPAGLTTAIALAAAAPGLGARIVVLEKGHYPREKFCAGALGGRGDRILDRLGARPDVPSVPIEGFSFATRAGERVERLGAIGRVVRRSEFDAALASTVRRRGVRLVEGARALRIEGSADAPSVRGPGAQVVTNDAIYTFRIVVGADGVGSFIRKLVGGPVGGHRAQVLEVDTKPTRHDRDRGLLHFDVSDRSLPGYAWDFPTVVGDEPLVCRGIYHLRMGDEKIDLEARLGERMRRIGLDIRSHKNKRFAERGFEPSLHLTKGPMMLVGEAAGIDPITGEGIAQSIEYGAMAGEFVARVLAGRTRLDNWTRHVRLSRLGIDLAARARLSSVVFGPRRASVESLLLASPSALLLGCRHFGALPLDLRELARVVGDVVRRVAR